MVLLCINGVERVLCKSWIESYSSTANVWENCKLMCLRYCTNATYATLVLQALYPCWFGATFSRWRAQRHFFLPCCIRLVGEKQLPLITLPLQITLFSLTKKLFFSFFSCGDVEFEMLMAQKSLSLLSHFMVLFEGKNFPACGWDNREMLSGGIFHSTWPYAIKGQFGHIPVNLKTSEFFWFNVEIKVFQ